MQTYPGCACDSPAHCKQALSILIIDGSKRSMIAAGYTWSFEPKTDWSATYASASEIQQYFADFCTRHDLHKYISLQHQVIGAEWLEERAEWRVKVQDLRTNTHLETSAHVLINAGGFLSRWKWPDIPGLHSFKGRLLHSAAWEKTVDLRDKRVGLIGNGYDYAHCSVNAKILPNWLADRQAYRYCPRLSRRCRSCCISFASRLGLHFRLAEITKIIVRKKCNALPRIQNTILPCGETLKAQ